MRSTASYYTALAAFFALCSAHMNLGPGGIAPYPGQENGPLNNANKESWCQGKISDSGKVTAVKAGGVAMFEVSGGAAHGGGSMQASVSFDGGKTWRVLKSFIGGFPGPSGGKYNFTMPKEARSGKAIFSWSWTNLVGNPEFYQQCGAINIEDGGSSTLDNRPFMFVSNMKWGAGYDCFTEAGFCVDYPNPSSEVDKGPDVGKLKKPSGPDCDKGPKGGAAKPDDAAKPPDAPKNGTTPPDTPKNGTATETAPPPATGGGGGGGGGKSYTVKSGDTCGIVAEALKISVADVIKQAGTDAGCTNLAIDKVVTAGGLRKRSHVMRFLN